MTKPPTLKMTDVSCLILSDSQTLAPTPQRTEAKTKAEAAAHSLTWLPKCHIVTLVTNLPSKHKPESEITIFETSSEINA